MKRKSIGIIVAMLVLAVVGGTAWSLRDFIKIENVLAETYFSQDLMQVFRQHVMNQLRDCHPLEEQVIRSLHSLEMMLVTDMQVHPQSFYDLVNIIREHEDIFPAWHASAIAKLYSPVFFENKKKSGGFWF